MSKDELAQQLHDKATLGESLSAEEEALLQQWYARQDQDEDAMLTRTVPPESVAALQTQVDAALAQLLTVSQRIQVLTAENEAVRRDIAALQRLLSQRSTAQPA